MSETMSEYFRIQRELEDDFANEQDTTLELEALDNKEVNDENPFA